MIHHFFCKDFQLAAQMDTCTCAHAFACQWQATLFLTCHIFMLFSRRERILCSFNATHQKNKAHYSADEFLALIW